MLTASEAFGSLDFLAHNPDLMLGLVFGSAAAGRSRIDSDIDVAVYPRTPMDGRELQTIADEIAMATGRAVDLIDLSTVNGELLRQILRSGVILFSKDPALPGAMLEKLLDWQEDFEPQLNALLDYRLEGFICRSNGS